MSRLDVFAEEDPSSVETHQDGAAIAFRLADLGVRFERWSAGVTLAEGATQEAVLAAYAAPVAKLMKENGLRSVDVVSMTPDHPGRVAARAKFLEEHTHAEDEVRFFVEGRGLFSIHAKGRVYAVLCERGDLISVPAGTRHWFDMGPSPRFTAIRMFGNPDGWVAQFTGSDIAGRFPRLDA